VRSPLLKPSKKREQDRELKMPRRPPLLPRLRRKDRMLLRRREKQRKLLRPRRRPKKLSN